MNKPAIVICAYNRPVSLLRLLNLVGNAIYKDSDISLIISIDFSIDTSVLEIAESFIWNYGLKKIINHPIHLGLKQHVLSCGKLSSTYESIILLEDDLGISPYFYSYSKEAMNFYHREERIAGISLYAYQVAESCFYPFKPIDDGSDFYFMQVASSWGQLWTKQQWDDFEEWFAINTELDDTVIPEYLKNWGKNSWKKHFIHYLIATSKYFVFPRLSLSTHFEEPGTNAKNVSFFQVPLQLTKKDYKFRQLDESNSVYDSSFELLPKCINTLNPSLSSFKYEVDLYGTKNIVINEFEYILSSKEGQNAEISFNDSLIPIESNVILNLKGDRIGLYKKLENEFSKRKLTIYNYLDAYNNEKLNSISVIIPVNELDLSSLIETLDSIVKQESSVLECIIVSNSSNYQILREFNSRNSKNIRLIIPEDKHTLPSLLAVGFQYATNDILTWILPGNIYYKNTFSKVQSIFRSYPMVPWILGIEHVQNKDVDFKSTELDQYRLDLNDIYKKMVKGELKTDTQLHFFKKHCISNFVDNPISLHDIFFKLSNKYQCFVVVSQFGKRSYLSLSELSEADTNRLIIQYSHFKAKPKSLFIRMFFILMNSVLLPKKVKFIFRYQFKDLPDVLRFDKNHETFYLSKY